MCGIFALIAKNAAPPVGDWDAVLNSIRHRGPDGENIIALPGCRLGHVRLSIIDLDTGGQPMSFDDGRYWITFNGEIYNFRELRNELLLLGSCFATASDTEVILAAYAKWGRACVDRLRGMFAFALWDRQESRLFCARDIFGEKPFYYALGQKGELAVASEISALIASRTVVPQLSLAAVDAFLALGYVPPDRTIYSNVSTLPPGHTLEWCDGTLKTSRYWQPAAATQPIEMGEAAERLGELLKQSVGRQMVSDVPVGAFLSGGLDSTTIVALMRQQGSRPIKTFSVGFGEHINELPYARAVAKKYHTEHHEIELGTPLVGEMLERMAVVFDEPFADTSNIPTYLISEFARRQVKVVLTGDGGDELFGGYSWTYPALVKSGEVARSTAWWILLRSLSRLTNHRWPALSLYSAACGLAARSPDMWARQVAQHVQIRRPGRRSLWGRRAGEVESFEPGGYYTPPEWMRGANRGFYFDLTSYLPGDILVKVDRAAMAHGLETRAPFLDRDLAEFALSLPVNLKVEGRTTKRLLCEACSHYWPDELKDRPKQGFGVPLDVWLARPDVRALRARIFSRHSALVDLLPGLGRRFTLRNDYQTWVLLTLGLWLEKRPSLT